MELRYMLTLEDYVAFSVDQTRNIPKYRRQNLIQKGLGFVIFAACGIGKAIQSPESSILSLALFFLLAFGWVMLLGNCAKLTMRRHYRSYFHDPANTQQLGFRKMTLKKGKMCLETQDGSQETIDLSRITRLTSDKAHYFLYFGDDAGMPVPYSAFTSKEQGWAFLEEIRKWASFGEKAE